MPRLVLSLILWGFSGPAAAYAFSCRYPPTHLRGFADVGGSRFVRLDFDLRLIGPECEVVIEGRGRCRPAGDRAMGVRFALKGRCPSETFVISSASYVRRETERVADVELEIDFGMGDRCHITWTSPALYFNSAAFGGPVPSLSGSIVCPTTMGSAGVAEFVRR